MKNLITAVSTTLLITACAATPSYAKENGKEYCKSVHELSYKVMNARQIGISFVELMEISNTEFMEMLVQRAFKVSQFHTEEYQQRAVEEFSNYWYGTCLDAVKEK